MAGSLLFGLFALALVTAPAARASSSQQPPILALLHNIHI